MVLPTHLAPLLCVVVLRTLRSFTSYLLQRLIMLGLSPILALLLQHLTQSGLFIYSVYVIMVHDWCSTHAAFVILQACVHFMKMHSYITVNRYAPQQVGTCGRTARRPSRRADSPALTTPTT